MEPTRISISPTPDRNVISAQETALQTSHGAAANRLLGRSVPLAILYVLFCLALATAAYLRPLPTYDRLLYAGAVASLRYSDPATVYRFARAEFDTQPSPFDFNSVANEPYFADVYNNPEHFSEQLGLFRVKLGYVTTGYALWRAGLPILTSLRLISAGSLLLVSLTLFLWTCDAVLSALLLLTPPMLNLGRTITADPFSTAIILLALFALALRRHILAAGLLLASVVIRSDNFLLVLILLAWMAWRRYLRASTATGLAVISVALWFLVNHFAGLYSWPVLMQHSFIQPEVAPITHPVAISFRGYLHALAELRAIPYTFMTIWILIAAAVWRCLPPRSFFRDLLPLSGLYIAVRLLIFPNFDDRFFVWTYLIAGVALLQSSRLPAAGNDAPKYSGH